MLCPTSVDKLFSEEDQGSDSDQDDPFCHATPASRWNDTNLAVQHWNLPDFVDGTEYHL